MQGQLLILDMNFCHFFIWTPLLHYALLLNALLVRFQRDADFLSEIIKKLNDYFFTILLLKIVIRRNDARVL